MTNRPQQTYVLRGGHLFDTTGGRWLHILSFCLDDPDQGSVVVLPIIAVGVAPRL